MGQAPVRRTRIIHAVFAAKTEMHHDESREVDIALPRIWWWAVPTLLICNERMSVVCGQGRMAWARIVIHTAATRGKKKSSSPLRKILAAGSQAAFTLILCLGAFVSSWLRHLGKNKLFTIRELF